MMEKDQEIWYTPAGQSARQTGILMEKTEMAKHEFGIMNTPPKLNERYDSFDPEEYNCISVPDDCIEPLLDKLTQMESYWHTLEQPAKGLAYYGITLIPPSSMRLFTELLERASGTDELRDLLLRA